MQGIATDVFGAEVMRDFVALRTAGRFDEAGGVLRRAVGCSTRRCSPPSRATPT